MQKLGDKLVEAGIAKPPRRTTFNDGRMATTEAYLYYKERCRDRGMDYISKMMFKWHLKHGQYLKAELAPNPFGRYPARIYAISMEAVLNFVEELAQREDQLTLQRQGNVIRRTTKERVQNSAVPEHPDSEPIPLPTAPDPPETTTETSDYEPDAPLPLSWEPTTPLTPGANGSLMDSAQAFEYLCKKATAPTSLNRTMFGFYLAYELIDSTFDSRARQVDKESIDAFLELCPTGLYKQHIDYVVKSKLDGDDMTMADAYDYYATLDTNPITMNSFRALVAAGIVVAIRAENKSSSPTLGFTKAEIEYFASLRKRITEKNADQPAAKAFKTKQANGTQRPRRKATQADTDSLDSGLQGTQAQGEALLETQASAIKARHEAEAPQGSREWVSIKDAYRYYAERVDQPHGEKWFAGKCYKSDPFEAVCHEDNRPGNPTGKKYLVNLDSVDTYLESNADTRATNLSFPLDKAYHKFRALMPPGLSLIQFKRLVRNNVIKSFIREGVMRVRHGDIGAYFQGQGEMDKSTKIPMTDDYSRANQNDVEAVKPTPTPTVSKTPKPTPKKDVNSDGPYVTLSMSKFPTKEGLAVAIEQLQAQGFRVEIEP